MSMIEMKNVIKRYEHNLAVDNLSLSIEEGEVFGLLGPNGAGKSTTIKMMMGLLRPNSGEIRINGYNTANNREVLLAKAQMGLVPQDLAIYGDMSAYDNVLFFGRLYGLRGKMLTEQVEEALNFVGLRERRWDKPKKFSGGMKRRLNIACAIVHQPKMIILDEPTVGIDPQSRNHILESIGRLNQRGSTIIYTSHYMEEVEALCSRVGIIDGGKLMACGTKEELKNRVAEDERLVLTVNGVEQGALEELKKIHGVKEVLVEDEKIEVMIRSGHESLQDILFVLGKYNVRVKGFHLVEPNLESLFLSLTGRRLRD